MQRSIIGITLIVALAICPGITHADNTGNLAVTAIVDSSATLTITNSAGPASTLTFSGYGNETVPASEGVITVTTRLSTTQGNANTVILVKCTDLAGQTAGDTLPAEDISYTHAEDTGGGTWHAGNLTNDWTTLAALTAGSGLYSGDQTFSLFIPASTNDDTYVGTISYEVIGF